MGDRGWQMGTVGWGVLGFHGNSGGMCVFLTIRFFHSSQRLIEDRRSALTTGRWSRMRTENGFVQKRLSAASRRRPSHTSRAVCVLIYCTLKVHFHVCCSTALQAMAVKAMQPTTSRGQPIRIASRPADLEAGADRARRTAIDAAVTTASHPAETVARGHGADLRAAGTADRAAAHRAVRTTAAAIATGTLDRAAEVAAGLLADPTHIATDQSPRVVSAVSNRRLARREMPLGRAARSDGIQSGAGCSCADPDAE